MDTKELINNIMNGDARATDVSFNALIQDKARTILDIKKVEMTADIYNTKEEK
jgi:hypothetical protein